jgi:hypothetical protein
MVFRNASGDLANLNKGCSCLGAGFHLNTDKYLQLYAERKSSLQQALLFTFQAARLRAGEQDVVFTTYPSVSRSDLLISN